MTPTLTRDEPAASSAYAAGVKAGREAECEACARLVLAGGDGVDRMETAIQFGANAAIAEAIRARAVEAVSVEP